MGTNYIAPTWRMPRNANKDKLSNYSIDFDSGSTEVIDTNSAFTSLTSFSISAWFKSDDTTSAAQAIISSRINSIGTSQGLDIYLGSDTLVARIYNNGATEVTTAFTDTTAWHQVVITYNGTTLELFLDSVSQGTATGVYTNSAANWVIGKWNNGVNYFNGAISQVSIFDYALTDGTAGTVDQVSYLYNLNNPMAIDGAEPVAYWPLGDNSNPIAVAGYPNISVGADSVFDFDGSSNFIDLGTTTDYNNGDLTAAIWVKASSSRSTTVYAFSNSGSPSIPGFDIKVKTNNEVQVSRITDTQNTASGWLNIGFAEDVWQHLAFTYNESTNSLKLFLNGVPKDTSTDTPHSPKTSTVKLTIGSYIGTSNFWEGELSNAQIWNAVLSPENITTLYNNGQPLMTGTQPEEANLRAWYKLNQSANWEADSAGNWQIPDAVSAYPQSFEFDGVSNEMTLPKGSMSDTGAKSVSVWIKNEITSGTDYVFNSRSGGYLANGITLIQTTTTGYITSNSYSPFQSSKIFTGYQTALHIPNDGQWHHMAWTAFPQAQRLKAYIDGVFVYEFIGATNVDTTPSTNVNVGQSGSPWTGKLSNFQVWDDVILSDGGVALNDRAAGQIAELYNNGSPLTTAIESSNLKAWYKLDNTANWNSTTDKWYIPNSGLTTNYSSALKFIPKSDGSGNALTIYQGTDGNGPTNLKFGATDSFSISTWIYLDSRNANKYVFVARGSYATGAQSYNRLTTTTNAATNHIVTWAVRDDNNVGASVNSTLATSGHPEDFNWAHLVAVVNRSTQTIQLFVNGEGSGTASISSLGGFENQDSIVIGNDGYTTVGGRYYYDGQLSNFAIFGSALSQSEIDTLYNNGTPEASLSYSPISWWKLDNLTTGIEDSGGGGNNITAASWITEVSNDVSVDALSSGMTAQNLVNNNVSTLNGESSGMDTTNLVQSDISKQIPFSSYSVNLDGTADYFNTGYSLTGSDLTLSYWVKADGIYPTYTWRTPATVRASNNITNQSLGAFYRVSTNLYPALQGFDSTGANYSTYTARGLGDFGALGWKHILWTYDNTTKHCYLYVDGVQQSFTMWGSATASTDYVIQASSITMSELWIGANYVGADAFDGKVSNVAMWNSILNIDDILNLYNNGVPQNLSNFRISPTVWYPLDQSYTYFNGSVLVARDVISANDATGLNVIQENIVGNAPGSESNGTGTNLDLSDLIGDMKDSKTNAYSINMADYADGVVNPANSGRSTLVP